MSKGNAFNHTPSKPTLMSSAQEFYHNATDVKIDMKENDPIVQLRTMMAHGVCQQVRKWALEQINFVSMKKDMNPYSFDDIFAPLAQAANVFQLPGFVNDALAQTCKHWIADQTNISTILVPFHDAMQTWIEFLNGQKDLLQKQIVRKEKDLKDVLHDLDHDNEIKVDSSRKKKDEAIDDLMKLLDKLIARLFKSVNITPMIEPSTRGVSSRGSRGSATLSPPKSSSRSRPLPLSPPSVVYHTPPCKDKLNKEVDEENLKVTPGDGHVARFHGKKDDDPDDDIDGDSSTGSSRSAMATVFFSFLCGSTVKNGDGTDHGGAGKSQTDNIVSDTRDKVLTWLSGESESTAAPWILSDLDFVVKLVQAGSVERDEAIHLFHCVHRVKGISPVTPSTFLDASCLAYLLCLVCVAFSRTGMVVTDMSKIVTAFNMLTLDGKSALWSERKWFRFWSATRPFGQFMLPLGLLGPDEPVETGWTTTTSTPPSASSIFSVVSSLDESMIIEGEELDSSLEIRGWRHRRSSSAPTTPQRKLCYGEAACDSVCQISMEGVPH